MPKVQEVVYTKYNHVERKDTPIMSNNADGTLFQEWDVFFHRKPIYGYD